VVQPEHMVLKTVKDMYLGNLRSVVSKLLMSAGVGGGSSGARIRERREMELWNGSG